MCLLELPAVERDASDMLTSDVTVEYAEKHLILWSHVVDAHLRIYREDGSVVWEDDQATAQTAYSLELVEDLVRHYQEDLVRAVAFMRSGYGEQTTMWIVRRILESIRAQIPAIAMNEEVAVAAALRRLYYAHALWASVERK